MLPNTEHTSNFFLLYKYHYYSGQVFLIQVLFNRYTIINRVLLTFEKGNIKSSITLVFVTVGYRIPKQNRNKLLSTIIIFMFN